MATKATAVKAVQKVQKTTTAAKAPAKPTAVKPTVTKATVTKTTVTKPAPVKPAAPVKAVKANDNKPYQAGQYVVYPAHGVGRIEAIESQEIGGIKLEVYVIYFEKEKMTLRVPVNRAEKAGLRALSTGGDLTKAFQTLQGKAKVARGMWSRRAQEYETKINSGDIVSIAEVVRDLHKNIDQPDRSYSERMIYESALTRLTNEVAAAESIDHSEATKRVLAMLKKVAA